MKKVAILGYGGRGYHYAKMCRQMDKDFQIVAVIEIGRASCRERV